MFLYNAWYVAARSHELDDGLLGRTILNQPIVFFRAADGAIAALEDRCCHRNAPLSVGRLKDGLVECGYHGLTFDRSGACVAVPGQSTIPPGARVRSYPVVDRHRWIWIWMGDPARADATLIPNMFWHDDPAWVPIADYFHVDCHYQALIDIQLDQTHSKYVHPTSLGSDAKISTPPKVTREPRAIRCERLMPNAVPPPLFSRASNIEGRADGWTKWIYVPPSNVMFDAGIAELGSGVYEGNRSKAFTIHNSHGITPESERTTHHFWVSARNFRIDDPKVTETMSAIRNTFREDLAMVEAQQCNKERFPDAPVIDVNADSPTIQARNLVARLIEEERRLTAA